MNFAKTFCKPGAYVEVAPAGLLVTLQYNQHGLLEKVWDGFDGVAESREFGKDEMNACRPFVPGTIPLHGGTTFIKGVLYCKDIPYTLEGDLPDCYKEHYLKKLLAGNYFKFVAGCVESYAARFKGALTMRNWFGIAGFTPMLGIVVPVRFTDDTLSHLLSASNSDINYPYLSGFFVFEDNDCRWQPSNLKQCLVTKTQQWLDKNGYMYETVYSGMKEFTIDKSILISNDIQQGTSVLYQRGPKIDILAVQNNTDGKSRQPLVHNVMCPICKKLYKVHSSGLTVCDDPNCLSRCYPRVKHMLTTLKLPELSYEDYINAVKNEDIIMLTDVLLMPQYVEIKPEVTLAEAMNAATPVSVCPDSTFFTKFANSCNKSIETALYYLSNPAKIVTELDVRSIHGRAFITWIQEPSNLLAMQTLLSCVKIKELPVEFEAEPIFRNKSFVITGKFIRGNHEYISAVLESYSATVYESIGESIPSCVITGSTYEGISGDIIQQARALDIPIYDENQFFSNYDIDSDIAQNLL